MRVLITGGVGFVGQHLIASLQDQFGENVDLVVTSKVSAPDLGGRTVTSLDVTDRDAVGSVIHEVNPTHIVHLAGLAAVPNAAANPMAAWQVNVFGTLNIAHALLDRAPNCHLIFIGSGQVYGTTGQTGTPLTEESALAPNNDYAVTKAAADLALGALVGRGLHCIRLRPFNHTGPGQSEDFVVPNFAKQIARIEAGQRPPEMMVGNLQAERDFLDVRDVTAAYAKIVAHSGRLPSGSILNIASGIPRSIREILAQLLRMSHMEIAVKHSSERMRVEDISRFVGSADLARLKLGWNPNINFSDTLRDIMEFSRREVASGS